MFLRVGLLVKSANMVVVGDPVPERQVLFAEVVMQELAETGTEGGLLDNVP